LVTHHRIIQLGLFGCALLFASLSHAATTLNASVDRNPVMVGESFTLTVTANIKTNRNTLDTSALLKDFIVGSTSVGSNTRIVNGEMSQQTSWNISLQHLTAGTYTIPSLGLDGATTQPIIVKIVEQPSAGKTQSDEQEIRLVANFEHNSAYVGQQLLYQVKLYIGASLQRAQLQAPTLEGADITPLGEDADSSEILDGRRYRVITRNYSIVPTKPGQFQLKGSVFRGDISLSQRTSFFNNGRSKPVTLISDSQPFVVHAIPKDFPGDWLVSAHVVLQDEWSEQTQYIVGEPITRTITLTAANTTVEQLPPITPEFGDNLNIYPDKRTTQQGLNGTTMIAQAVQKIAVIPGSAGRFVIPEVKIPWFNSATQQVAWATIAPKTIEVAAAPSSSTAQPSAPAVKHVNTETTTLPTPTLISASPSLLYWQLATAILSFLLLICTVIIYVQRNATFVAVPKAAPVTNDLQRRLEQAMAQRNANQILKLLPMWLTKTHQLDLDQLMNINPDLAQTYQLLAQNQFGHQKTAIDYSQLTKQFKSFCNTGAPSRDSLLKLYPNG